MALAWEVKDLEKLKESEEKKKMNCTNYANQLHKISDELIKTMQKDIQSEAVQKLGQRLQRCRKRADFEEVIEEIERT